MLGVSALTGAGLAELVAAIKVKVGYLGEGGRFTARKRHLQAIDRALAASVECCELAARRHAGRTGRRRAPVHPSGPRRNRR